MKFDIQNNNNQDNLMKKIMDPIVNIPKYNIEKKLKANINIYFGKKVSVSLSVYRKHLASIKIRTKSKQTHISYDQVEEGSPIIDDYTGNIIGMGNLNNT